MFEPGRAVREEFMILMRCNTVIVQVSFDEASSHMLAKAELLTVDSMCCQDVRLECNGVSSAKLACQVICRFCFVLNNRSDE